ncbi:hypothetical protein PIB30_048397 [Stylosanthes scabra]|uniref:LysM domain-containing protein n=1 Tax=Stylosanthes scabra TaxID=79078 RepID=A0ABU6ZFS4_9FABA|nr:hypothetical protein [Stylosanthes scabra]
MEMFMWKVSNGYHHDQFACGYGKKVPKMMSSCASSPSIALGCIQHSISKMDTLAGIAIKYGVEVADIKKMNGLGTDRQIPIDGASSKQFESFRSLETNSSMNYSQRYYGTVPTNSGTTICNKDSTSATSNRPFHHQKSRSLAESILDEIMKKSDVDHNTDKENIESNIRATEILMRVDSIGGLPSRTRNSLAQRQKSASRVALHIIDGANGVRRSSSMSCLPAQVNRISSNMRSNSRTNMKQDYFMATGRTNKAAIH